MAIVSISKIQVRRGQKNTGSGVPQLSSGEFGWAVDARELYIGNGSVSEGAPMVGNTRLLTEHDNIFELAGDYLYKSDTIATGTVERTLQSRLDDVVYLDNFENIHTAIQQLYTQAVFNDGDLLDETSSDSFGTRVTLHLPAGIITTDTTIQLPPYVRVKGAGIDKTKIVSTANPVFETITLADQDTLVFPKHVELGDLTVEFVTSATNGTTGIKLSECTDSSFKNIKLVSNWDIVSNDTPSRAVDLSGLGPIKNNTFENIIFSNIEYGIFSNFDITNLDIRNCVFEHNRNSIAFGLEFASIVNENDRPSDWFNLGSAGQTTGAVDVRVESCRFDHISEEAILVENGGHVISVGNVYNNVGNHNGNYQLAVCPNIRFEPTTCSSINDYFERSKQLSNTFVEQEPGVYVKYPSEVAGKTLYESKYANSILVGNTGGVFEPFLRVPVSPVRQLINQSETTAGAVFVDYVYTAEVNGDVAPFTGVQTLVKEGTLAIQYYATYTYDEISQTWTQTDIDTSINDDFSFVSKLDSVNIDRLTFTAEQHTINAETDSIIISANNQLDLANSGIFYYTVRIKS